MIKAWLYFVHKYTLNSCLERERERGADVCLLRLSAIADQLIGSIYRSCGKFP